MLEIRMRKHKAVIKGIDKVARKFPKAITRALSRIGVEVYRLAYQWLSGPGAKASGIPGGGYPVPVRSGHLRRALNWLKPGKSKHSDVGTFRARDDEVVVYDSAEYAEDIFEGKGASSQYGERNALQDALELFNRGANIPRIMDEELRREINREGF